MGTENRRGVFVASMGCRVNQYDGAALGHLFADEGYRAVASPNDADLVVLNSCTVTDSADKEAYKLLRRLRREAPGATLVVTGCLAQRDPHGLAALEEVDLVLGMSEKRRASEIVRAHEEGLSSEKIQLGDLDGMSGIFLSSIDGLSAHTRAFLKIQEGCNRSCSYCIIPSTRGRERSVPPAAIRSEIRRLAQLGIPEVVLTGVHLGGYGLDLDPKTDLRALLETLEEIPEDVKLRISSLEPMEADERLLRTIAASRRIVPHLHLPMQSGSTRVLRDMNRGYSAERFLELAELATSLIPRLNLGTDLIVGYPTEGEAEAEETARLVERAPLAYCHVFPYSPRSGTPSARLSPVDPRAVRERAARLRSISSEKRRAFASNFVGQRLPVLLFGGNLDGSVEGQSDNYLSVLVSSEEATRSPIPRRRYVDLDLGSFDGAFFEGLVPAERRELARGDF